MSDIILKGTHPGTIPARLSLIWFSGFRREDLNVIFYQNKIKLNLAGMVPGWVPFKIMSDIPALHSRWPLLLKIEISSKGGDVGHNFERDPPRDHPCQV
jgi:hypothetical protein